MKRLTCEMCGSSNLIKIEGLFECQNCGTKYSVDEAKKLMIEVDGTVEVTGTVQVDNSNKLENLLKSIRTLYSDGKFEEVYQKCDEILMIDPEYPEALLYQGFADAWKGTTGTHNNIYAAFQGFKRAISSARERGENRAIDDFITFGSTNMPNLGLAIKKLVTQVYSVRIGSNNRLCEMESRLMAHPINKRDLEEHKRKAEEYLAKSSAEIRELEKEYNKLFSLQNDFAEIMINEIDEPAECDEFVFTSLKAYISVYKNAKDLTDYSVKNRCNQLIDRVEQLEKKGNEIRIEQYWESHKEEKETLVTKIKELDNIITTANEQISAFKPQIDEIKAKENDYAYLGKEIGEKRDKIYDLKNERSRLGIFQGKRKKEINEEISSLENELSSKELEYNRKKEDVNNLIKKELDEIKEQCKPFEDEIAKARDQRQEIQSKLDKPF